MFGIGGGEFAVVLLLAIVLVGPTKLPQYARKAGSLLRQARQAFENAKNQASDELGRDIDTDMLRNLDPRRLDPRYIVREALSELDEPPPASQVGTTPITKPKGQH